MYGSFRKRMHVTYKAPSTTYHKNLEKKLIIFGWPITMIGHTLIVINKIAIVIGQSVTFKKSFSLYCSIFTFFEWEGQRFNTKFGCDE
jgi:hypothetical protein